MMGTELPRLFQWHNTSKSKLNLPKTMTIPVLFYPKDFLETAEGLIFAVVAPDIEDEKVLCFLRYVKEPSGWKKYHTDSANAFLRTHHPDYLHFSPRLSAHLHAVPISRIHQHHHPRRRLHSLMQTPPQNAVEADLYQLGQLFQKHGVDLQTVGVTGSVLVGVQNAESDIDLVCYDRASFQQCRVLVHELIAQGDLEDLSDIAWQQSYQRREADLSHAEYVWHERRKANKALINKRKFDLSLFSHENADNGVCQKLGSITLQCTVLDDHHAFDYPARYLIDHGPISSIICFTATYVGQAFQGERIEVAGLLEATADGKQRIVVGASREARGEYIKVIR
jgi:predicted nucleotidyltransferase